MTPTSTAKKIQVAPEDRVPISQKIAYGMGSANDVWGNWLFPSMIWPVYNIFLLVSPSMISLVLMVNRLVDAVSDPFFGWLSDNTRSRFGRRRPFILVASIVAGLSFPALFMVSPGWSERAYVWYMIISSGIFITIVSAYSMPYQSLGAELTPDYNERTSVFSYKTVIQKIPEIGMFFAAMFITLNIFNDPETGKPDILQGARIYAMLVGGIMILVGVVVFVVVKERYYEKVVVGSNQHVSMADTVWKAIKCRPFRVQLSMALSIGLGMSMVGALGYYATVYYVCQGDVALGSKWNFAMGLSNLGFAVAGVPFYSFIARRAGKKVAMIVVMGMAIAIFAATWVLYNPSVKWLQLLAAGGISFTTAGFWMLYGAMMADVVDYDELETGHRREGAFNACGSWMMKVGMALGIGASGVVLEFTGFDAALPVQSDYTLALIRLFLAGIPIMGYGIALFALFRLELTPKRMAEVRTALEARRGTV